MKVLAFAALPLSLVLMTALVPGATAAEAERRSSAAPGPSFAPVGAWRVSGYKAFREIQPPHPGDRPCEALQAEARFYAARDVDGSRWIRAEQAVASVGSEAEAAALAKQIASKDRNACVASARSESGVRSVDHQYHLKLGDKGSAVGPGQLAVWSTAYRTVVLVEVANGPSRGTGTLVKTSHMTVVAVGHVGNHVTVLSLQVEKQLKNPPWKALRKTARTALGLLSADPWSA